MSKEKIKKEVLLELKEWMLKNFETARMNKEDILEAIDLTIEKTAKAILEEVEKRLNLLVNLNELEYMEVFVDKTKDFMTDKVVHGKIKALKGVAEEIKEQFGVK